VNATYAPGDGGIRAGRHRMGCVRRRDGQNASGWIVPIGLLGASIGRYQAKVGRKGQSCNGDAHSVVGTFRYPGILERGR